MGFSGHHLISKLYDTQLIYQQNSGWKQIIFSFFKKEKTNKLRNLQTLDKILWKQNSVFILTLRPPRTTIVPYANSLDPNETVSNSPSHPDPSCLTLRQHFHQLLATLKHFEY